MKFRLKVTIINSVASALSDYTEAVERREELLQNRHLPRIHSLLSAFEVRAVLYRLLGEAEKACTDYKKALFYMEQFDDAELTIEEQLIDRIKEKIKELA